MDGMLIGGWGLAAATGLGLYGVHRVQSGIIDEGRRAVRAGDEAQVDRLLRKDALFNAGVVASILGTAALGGYVALSPRVAFAGSVQVGMSLGVAALAGFVGTAASGSGMGYLHRQGLGFSS